MSEPQRLLELPRLPCAGAAALAVRSILGAALPGVSAPCSQTHPWFGEANYKKRYEKSFPSRRPTWAFTVKLLVMGNLLFSWDARAH